MYDYVIVGAGLFGCVMAERIANDLGKSVLIVEKKSHIAGACFSEVDPETGIEVHPYGTHVFHTSDPRVWDYVNRFCAFNDYSHRVLAVHQGRIFPMPVNLDTINAFYNLNLSVQEAEVFLDAERKKEGCPNPATLEQQAIRVMGRPLYEAFIRGYTMKHWGKDPKDLPAGIIKRLPVRTNRDNSYFINARWQGIPLDGYTNFAGKLLHSTRISLRLKTDYLKDPNSFQWREGLIYTGPLDAFFGFGLGRLAWRSVRLDRSVMHGRKFQDASVVNYVDRDIPFTRIHEPKHLHPERPIIGDKTVICYEYPGEDPEEPTYPVNDNVNNTLHKAYLNMARQVPGLIIGGRLGNYSYSDMDQTIAAALRCYETEVQGR